MNTNLLDGAYGGGRTGTDFDLYDYLRKPRTWIRLLCVAFSLFTVIVEYKFTGVTALLIAILLVVTDVIFNRITSINKRKKLVISECALSAYIVFADFLLFFICIIIWTGAEVPEDKNTTPATGTLFLLLIMTLVWSSSLFFSYENYKEGVQINFSTGYIDPDDMMAGDSYPPINQTQQNLYDEEAPYQDKEQLLRFEDGQE